MNIQQAIAAVLERRDLSADEMSAVMRQIMTGEATPAQIGGFLVGLRMKGETVDEVAAAAGVMRELAAKVAIDLPNVVDIVGTGGDASGTFNVSTACSLVAAAAGANVAKHGNRSVSSKSGAADLLEQAGVNLDLDPAQVGACIEQAGVGFMFAPKHHAAMKHAIGPRREMGVRTIFNVLGPLTNPAGAPNQLLGVYAAEWVQPLAEVLRVLGSNHVMVVHSEDGMDEISLNAPTQVAELKDGEVNSYSIAPEDFGLARAPLSAVQVDGPEESLATIKAILDGEPGAPRDMVLLNCGAALYVSGVAESIQDGIARATAAIDGGAARDKLAQLVEVSQSFAEGA